MIKHVVIFKLTPPYTPEEKAASVQKLNDIFGPLGKNPGYSLEYRTGVNTLDSEHAGDFVIDSLFASPEDLKRYNNSQEHREAVAGAAVVRKTKLIIDYIV